MVQQLQTPQGPFVLTDLARKRLDQRIAENGNNIDAVESEVRAKLAEIDSVPMPEDGPERTRMQAERVHLQQQLGYLMKVRNAQAVS